MGAVHCLLKEAEEQVDSKRVVKEAPASLAQTEFWAAEVAVEAHLLEEEHGLDENEDCLVLEEVEAQSPCLVLVVGQFSSVL